MFSDRDIRDGTHWSHAVKLISPFVEEQINPASYDVLLDRQIRIVNQSVPVVDCARVDPGYTELLSMPPGPAGGYVMHPGEFVLATTIETISLPTNIWARIEGKSSLGRIGLAVHITAGFIDPGFSGPVTLEMVNMLGRPIRIHAGMRIAQIAFGDMKSRPQVDYSKVGHYQHQVGPTESRYRMPVAP